MNGIDLKSGELIFDEFNIDFSKSLSKQLDCLSEDLIQIKYSGGYLIDVGWYPEYQEKGNFIRIKPCVILHFLTKSENLTKGSDQFK